MWVSESDRSLIYDNALQFNIINVLLTVYTNIIIAECACIVKSLLFRVAQFSCIFFAFAYIQQISYRNYFMFRSILDIVINFEIVFSYRDRKI